ncbi:hypothetical protein OV450_8479, partial [Actinobacteria bacterium OV450]
RRMDGTSGPRAGRLGLVMAASGRAAAAVAGDVMVDEVVQRLLDKADASGAALLG